MCIVSLGLFQKICPKGLFAHKGRVVNHLANFFLLEINTQTIYKRRQHTLYSQNSSGREFLLVTDSKIKLL